MGSAKAGNQNPVENTGGGQQNNVSDRMNKGEPSVAMGSAIPGSQNQVGNNGGGQQNNTPAQTNEGEPRRPIIEGAAVVKDLIEKCVNMYLNRDEVVEVLRLHSRIDPRVTLSVWQKLEQDNPDFFRAYHRRVVLCKQIETFNRLLQKQSELIDVQRLRLEACCISQAESTASNLNFLPDPVSYSGNTPSNNNSPVNMDVSEESGNGSGSPGSLRKSYSDPGCETITESNPPIPRKNNSF